MIGLNVEQTACYVIPFDTFRGADYLFSVSLANFMMSEIRSGQGCACGVLLRNTFRHDAYCLNPPASTHSKKLKVYLGTTI